MSLPPSASNSTLSAPIDLARVRKLFASPADVAGSDFLRREVSNRMQERLDLVKILPQKVLDAGCGEGVDMRMLKARYAQARVLGIDASALMLALAQGGQLAALPLLRRWLYRWSPANNADGVVADFLCGDFAALPLPSNAIDLVWSNLALHWHPQPDCVFAEWRRVLRVDGLLMFSCFGPDTFQQLRSAFAEVDNAPHALPFVDMHDFGDMLVNVGFSTPVMDMESITVTYDSVEKLMADVRSWGGNPLSTQRRGLMGKGAWKKVVDAIEQMRQPDGRIPLTFEIIYGHAFRPVPNLTASGEAIIRFR